MTDHTRHQQPPPSRFAPQNPAAAYFVALVDGAGTPRGAGFLLDGTTICTCAHVVCDALGIDRQTAEMPRDPVDVRFSFLGDHAARGWLVSWHGMAVGDVALVELAPGDVPPRARPARLIEAQRLTGRSFTVEGPVTGTAGGRFGTMRQNDTIELLPDLDRAGYRITRGFSGAPVLDIDHNGVVGMVLAVDEHAGVAELLPTYVLTRLIDVALSAPADQLAGLAEIAGGQTATEIEQFLEEYLGTASTLVPFGGRAAELDDLDRWLARGSEPYALVAAPAGGGKSALLARWAHRLAEADIDDVAYLPISIRFKTARRARALTLLGLRLRHLSGHEDRPLPSDPDAWWEEIANALKRSAPNDPRRLVVVIDGIDEAAGWSVEHDLALPSRLGEGIKVVLSARGGIEEWAGALRLRGRALPLVLGPLEPFGIAEVVASIGGLKSDDPDRFLLELARITKGDPLLLKLYVDALGGRELIAVDDLARIEAGWKAYMAGWWRDQERQWDLAGRPREDARSDVSVLLDILATALGPLTAEEIAVIEAGRLTDMDYLKSLIGDARRFVVTLDSAGLARYSLAHPKFRDYWRGESMSAAQRARWERRFLDFGRATLDEVRHAGRMVGTASYAVEHYGAHLEAAQGPDQWLYDLIDPGWHRAWEERTGTDGFVDDVSRAWRRAELQRDLAVQIKSALVRASIDTIAASLPPDLLATFVEQGAWTVGAARAAARRAANNGTRPDAIEELARRLAYGSHVDDALAIASDLPDRGVRADLLADIALELVARGRWSDGFDVAADVPLPAVRMETLRELAATFDGTLLDATLDLWQATSWQVLEPGISDELLVDLVSSLAVHRPQAALRTIPRIRTSAIRDAAGLAAARAVQHDAPLDSAAFLAYVDDPLAAVDVAIAIAPGLPPPRRRDLLERLWRRAWPVADPVRRARAVIPLAAYDAGLHERDDRFESFPDVLSALTPVATMAVRDATLLAVVEELTRAGLVADARAAAASILSRDLRERGYAAIAQAEAAAGGWAPALVTARDIEGATHRISCLLALTRSNPPADEQEAIVHLGLEVAQDPLAFERALDHIARLAAALEEPARRQFVNGLSDAGRWGADRDRLRGVLVERLAHAGLPAEALAIAATITETSERDAAIASAGPALADGGHVAAAIEAAARIAHGEYRDQTLGDVARSCLRGLSLDDGLLALDEIRDGDIRRELHLEFGPELARAGRATAAVDALSASTVPAELASAITALAPYLTDRSDVDAAIRLAIDRLEPSVRVAPLVALSAAPGNEAGEALLEQALEASRRIADVEEKASARASMVRAIARAGAADRARETARKAASPRLAADSLIDVARVQTPPDRALITEAIELAMTVQLDDARDDLLMRAVTSLDGTGSTAERAARAVRDPLRRSHALEQVARNRDDGASVLAEAAEAVRTAPSSDAADVRSWELSLALCAASDAASARTTVADIANPELRDMAASEVARALVDLGEGVEAIAVARLCSDDARARLLVDLLRGLPESVRQQALNEAILLVERLPGARAFPLLAELVPHAPERLDLERLAEAAVSVDHATRWHLLLRLTRTAPGLGRRLVEIAVETSTPEERSQSMGRDLESIVDLVGPVRAARAIAEIPDGEERARHLVALAAHSKDSATRASAIRDAVLASPVTVARSPQLRASHQSANELRELAYDAASAIADDEERVGFLAQVSASAVADGRAEALAPIMAELARRPEGEERSRAALVALRTLIAAEVQGDVSVVLDVITETEERVRALVTLSKARRGSSSTTLLSEAVALAERSAELTPATALDLVRALAAAGLSQRAEPVAAGIADGAIRYRAWLALAAAEPPAGPYDEILSGPGPFAPPSEFADRLALARALVQRERYAPALDLLLSPDLVVDALPGLAPQARRNLLELAATLAIPGARLTPDLTAACYREGLADVVLERAALAPQDRHTMLVAAGALSALPRDEVGRAAERLSEIVARSPASTREAVLERMATELADGGMIDEAARYALKLERSAASAPLDLVPKLFADGRIHTALAVAARIDTAAVHDDLLAEAGLGRVGPAEARSVIAAMRLPESRFRAWLQIAAESDQDRYAVLDHAARSLVEVETQARHALLPKLVEHVLTLPDDDAHRIWCLLLHRLARGARADLLLDLRALTPVLGALGGAEGLAGGVDVIDAVTRWYE